MKISGYISIVLILIFFGQNVNASSSVDNGGFISDGFYAGNGSFPSKETIGQGDTQSYPFIDVNHTYFTYETDPSGGDINEYAIRSLVKSNGTTNAVAVFGEGVAVNSSAWGGNLAGVALNGQMAYGAEINIATDTDNMGVGLTIVGQNTWYNGSLNGYANTSKHPAFGLLIAANDPDVSFVNGIQFGARYDATYNETAQSVSSDLIKGGFDKLGAFNTSFNQTVVGNGINFLSTNFTNAGIVLPMTVLNNTPFYTTAQSTGLYKNMGHGIQFMTTDNSYQSFIDAIPDIGLRFLALNTSTNGNPIFSNRMDIYANSGIVRIYNLSGTGSYPVYVDANGNLTRNTSASAGCTDCPNATVAANAATWNTVTSKAPINSPTFTGTVGGISSGMISGLGSLATQSSVTGSQISISDTTGIVSPIYINEAGDNVAYLFTGDSGDQLSWFERTKTPTGTIHNGNFTSQNPVSYVVSRGTTLGSVVIDHTSTGTSELSLADGGSFKWTFAVKDDSKLYISNSTQEVFSISTTGAITALQLAGSGYDYLCLDPNGTFTRNNTAC